MFLHSNDFKNSLEDENKHLQDVERILDVLVSIFVCLFS